MKKLKAMLTINQDLEEEVQTKIDILTEKVCTKFGYRVAFAYMHDSNRILKDLGFKKAKFIEICNDRKKINSVPEISTVKNDLKSISKPEATVKTVVKEEVKINNDVYIPYTPTGCTNISNTRFPVYSSC